MLFCFARRLSSNYQKYQKELATYEIVAPVVSYDNDDHGDSDGYGDDDCDV